MTYASANTVSEDLIPVVDITALRDGTRREAVAQDLLSASRNAGFLYVAGHGVSQDLIDAVRTQAYAFFRAEEAVKQTVKVSQNHRGWIGCGGARMLDGAKTDLKESFVWGYQDKNGSTPADHELRGPNQWPAAVPALQDLAMRYFWEADRVARQLLEGFAIGLNLAPDLFHRTCQVPLSRASCVWYPPQSETLGEDTFGVGPHTDFGVLTILCQDDVGGLQVQTAGGDWVEARPIEGTLVVNVGDLLDRWTNGLCKSTPHRVVNRSGRERLSLVLAFDPDPDTPIDQKDVFGPDHEPTAPGITCGDYLVWRFGKAFGYRRGTDAPKVDE